MSLTGLVLEVKDIVVGGDLLLPSPVVLLPAEGSDNTKGEARGDGGDRAQHSYE